MSNMTIIDNKRGQFAIITFFFAIIIFFFIWAFWLGGFLSDYADQAISAGTVTGLEAFILANLNLFIFLGIILTVFIVIYLGAQS